MEHYPRKPLVKALNKALETCFDENNLFLKTSNLYTIQIEIYKSELRVVIYEKNTTQFQKEIDWQTQKQISDLNEKVANIKSEAAIAYAKLIDKKKKVESTLAEQIAQLESVSLENLKQLKKNERSIIDVKGKETIYKRKISTLMKQITELEYSNLVETESLKTEHNRQLSAMGKTVYILLFCVVTGVVVIPFLIDQYVSTPLLKLF